MVPIALPTDRQALEAALQSIGPWDTESVRMAWITNTFDLNRIAGSPALAKEAKLKGLSISEHPFALEFDDKGNLGGLRESIGGG